MKPISLAIASVFIGAAASLAAAQTDQGSTATTLSNANAPTTTPDVGADAAVRAGHNAQPVPGMVFVQEPVASASKDDDNAKAIVEALNGDASMKDSKITVQPTSEGTITLTGSTMTKAQAKRAAEVATAQVGEGKVVNAIRDSEA